MRKIKLSGVSSTIGCFIGLLLLSACASSPEKIGTAYVSPLQYQDYSCKQLGAEASRVSRRTQDLYHEIDANASGDNVAMGVGLVLFWPALFFIDGDEPNAQEYARLKGEYEALEQASVKKNCGLKFKTYEPVKEVSDKKQQQYN